SRNQVFAFAKITSLFSIIVSLSYFPNNLMVRIITRFSLQQGTIKGSIEKYSMLALFVFQSTLRKICSNRLIAKSCHSRERGKPGLVGTELNFGCWIKSGMTVIGEGGRFCLVLWKSEADCLSSTKILEHHTASAHIPCGFAGICLGKAHGLWALGLLAFIF
ncbi:MAG: hypothetical protein NTY70_05950, partial [Burkholderiales bacterium]|nr:hypothetical protein [Burkholderiales bacterium]